MFHIAHISDLHLSKLHFSLQQFFSKRWLGNLNLLFSRKKQLQTSQLWDLIDVFSLKKIDYLFVTGDITSTSHPKEFELAEKLFSAIRALGIIIFYTPGNHDVYTKGAQKEKRFYQFCKNPHPFSLFSQQHDRVEIHKLPENWWYVLCDTSVATPLFSSRGYFSEKTQNTLNCALLEIPKTDSIILGTHFPFSQTEKKRKILAGGDALESVIKKHHHIKIFLHGHTHKNQIIPPHNNLPLILDSGSSAHNTVGRWNHLLLSKDSCDVEVYHWQNRQKPKGKWLLGESKHFTWN